MDKLRQNLTIYDNLLENETSKLNNGEAAYESMKNGVMRNIKDFVDKNLK